MSTKIQYRGRVLYVNEAHLNTDKRVFAFEDAELTQVAKEGAATLMFNTSTIEEKLIK